ncbi:MAG: TRAP transporter large permease [Bradymonadaceae bacterium]
MSGILVAVGLVALALLGTPLFIVLAGAAVYSFSGSGTGLVVLAGEHYKLTASPHLITIPFFTFAGFLMAESRAADRLVRVSQALFGWMPGGLAVVVIVSCACFTTFTGASGVTIIALGGLLFPMLVSEGYPEEFSLGLVTSSGSIGLLFPPSLPIILYGIVAKTSIDKLFLAGVLPGALMVSVLGAFSVVVGHRADVRRQSFDWGELAESAWEAKWEMLVPVVVLVSIYGGFVTVAEASAIAAIYVLIVEVFILDDIAIWGTDPEEPNLYGVIRDSMSMVDFIEQYVESRMTFLLLLTVFLLIVGAMMDIFSAITVVVPLIAPLASEYGVDPVHLGIIFLANLEIGYITPPVGLNLFISSLAFDEPVLKLYRVALPFFFLLLGSLLVITFWEDLSLFAVRLAFEGTP